MGLISQETIEAVRQRADIVDVIGRHVSLKMRGRDFWGCCPFHHEKTPSFKVSPSHQAFYCFGCHKSGNVFSYLQEKENLDFVGAVRYLAQQYGITVEETTMSRSEQEQGHKKEKIFYALERVMGWYRENLLLSSATHAANYLLNRGITKEWVDQFDIGYAPERGLLQWAAKQSIPVEILKEAGLVAEGQSNAGKVQYYDAFRDRIVFTIRDELGRPVGFSARTLVNDAKTRKYINTPETLVFKKNRILYGLYVARKAFKDKGFALVCEGQLDVIACFRAGLVNAVCSQGTAFTEEHARLLRRFTDRVCFCFDADKAGIKATLRSIEIAIKENLTCQIAELPEGEDPDSLLKSKGAEALRYLIEQAKSAMDFLFEYGCKQYGKETPEGKKQIIDLIFPMIKITSDQILQTAYLQELAIKIDMPFQVLNSAFDNFSSKTQSGNYEFRHRQTQAANNGIRPTIDPTNFTTQHSSSATEINTQKQASTAEKMLLELALYSRQSAEEIARLVNLKHISQTAVGISLNLILAETDYGQWEDVHDLLTKDQKLIADPIVAKALMQPQFDTTQEDQEYYENVIKKAIADCVNSLEKQYIEIRIFEIQNLLKTEDEQLNKNDLMLELAELLKKKKLRKNF